MDFKDQLDFAQAQAIVNTLENSELSVWRSICRTYSEKFATPLHLCLDGSIPAEDVLLAVFESQLENFEEEKDLEGILDTIYALEDPDYESSKKNELNDFIDKAEKEESERLALGKPIHKALKSETSLPSQEILPKKKKLKELPKSGGIDLSYLTDGEDGSGGF